jgi:hypothetical protein
MHVAARHPHVSDVVKVSIRTTPATTSAGVEHSHVAVINSETGSGWTDYQAGHRHKVVWLEFLPAVDGGGRELGDNHQHDIAGRATSP